MAKVTWAGSLMEGSGTIEGVGSGAFGLLDVSWTSRAEAPRLYEPGGAHRRRLGVVLGMALTCAGRRRNAAGAARDVRHRHVPAG